MLFEALREIFDVLRRPARHVHAEVQAHGGENFLDLVERLSAEVRGAEHFRLGLLDEVADIDDVVVLQAVRRTNRELELVHLLEKRRIERQLRRSGRDLFLARLFEVDEDLELVLEDAGRIGHCVLRRYGAVGLNRHDQLVVVENLALAGVLDAVRHLPDRTVERVDRDEADRSILGTIALGGNVALACRDRELHADFRALIKGAEHEIGVQDLHVANRVDIARGYDARAGLAKRHALRTFALHLDGDHLYVEDDVRHVLANARDGREFVQHAVDMYRRHRGALERRQEDATQGIAERRAKAALERLGHDRGDTLRIVAGGDFELVGLNQLLPVLLDHNHTS